MSFSEGSKKEPLDPKIYTKGMALLSALFPAVKISPDVYYAFLDDIREDDYIVAIKKVCRETKELFPNTNLVALIREKANDAARARTGRTLGEIERQKKIEFVEPDYEKIEAVKKEWNELKAKLAREKEMEQAKAKE